MYDFFQRIFSHNNKWPKKNFEISGKHIVLPNHVILNEFLMAMHTLVYQSNKTFVLGIICKKKALRKKGFLGNNL